MALNLDTRPYNIGYHAAIKGQSLDSCRFSKKVKRNCWVRGYRDGLAELDRRANTNSNTTTEQDRQKSEQWLEKIRTNVLTTN